MEGQVLSQRSEERRLSWILFTETQQRGDQQLFLRTSVRFYGEVLVSKDTGSVPVFGQITPTDNSHPQTWQGFRGSRKKAGRYAQTAGPQAGTNSISTTPVSATGPEASRIVP